jgi:hypothetical protein
MRATHLAFILMKRLVRNVPCVKHVQRANSMNMSAMPAC